MSNILKAMVLALFRQRAVFWSVVVATLLAAGAASLLLPPVWRVHAVIAAPRQANEQMGVGLLTSRELHRQVVTRLGAQALYPGLDEDAAAAALGRDLIAIPGQRDNIVLSYDGRDGAEALKAIQTVIEVFSEQYTHLVTQSLTGSLDQEETAYKAALDESRRRLDEYRQSNKVSAQEENRRQIMRQRASIEADLKRTIDSQNELAAKLRTLRAQMDQTPATVESGDQAGRYKVVDEAKARLLELQLKEQELLSKYKDTSQFVINVRDEINRVQALLKEMSASLNQRSKPAANEPYAELSKELGRTQSQANSMQSRRAALEGQLAEMDKRAAEMDVNDRGLHELEQMVDDAESNVRRIDTARLAQTMGATQAATVAVIEAPAAPRAPVQPNPSLYFSLAVPVGLLAGFGLALLAEAYSSTFATPSDVERRLGLPVLAVLPFKS